MERGAANTLRVLGIIASVIVTLLACGLLLLLAICSGGGRSSDAGKFFPWMVGAFLLMVGGIWSIVRLAKGIMHSREQVAALEASGTSAAGLSEPLTISREGQKAIDLVVFALCASFFFSIASRFLNLSGAPQGPAANNWLLVQIADYVLYYGPFGILLYSFLTRPARWTFVYAQAIPAALLLMTAFNMLTLRAVYIHNSRTLLLVGISSVIEVAILVTAWKAARENNATPDPGSVLIAGLAAFVYFFIVRGVMSLLFRFVWR